MYFFYTLIPLSASAEQWYRPYAYDASDSTEQTPLFQSKEVVIVSTRINDDNLHSIYPVSILTKEMIDRHPSNTIPEAIAHTPGIALSSDGPWETTVSLRGFSRANIVMMIDNTRIETANDIAGVLSLVNSHDAERIESIRLPGAALYGTGSLGGIINMITVNPSFSDHYRLKADAGSDIASVNKFVSQYLAVDQSSPAFGLRLSAEHRKAGNTITPNGELPNSQFMDFNVNGRLAVKAFGNQTASFTYQRSQGENIGIPGGDPIGSSAIARFTLTKRELMSADYHIPNFFSKASSLKIHVSQQTIVRNVEIIQSPTLTTTPHAVHTTISAQIESKLIPWDGNMLVVGIDGWKRNLNSRREKIDTKNDILTEERPVPLASFSSVGLYAQDEWSLVPNNATVLIGARYDWISIHNSETYFPDYIYEKGIFNFSPSNQQLLWTENTLNNHSWSSNAGVRFSLSSMTTATATLTTAFRSPSLEERYQFLDLGSCVRLGNADLQPERSTGIDIGVRIIGTQHFVAFNCFANNLTNLVSDIPGMFENRPAYIKQNIGKSRLYGYEISMEQALAQWSVMRVSCSFVQGEDILNHTNLRDVAPLNGSVAMECRSDRYGTMSISSRWSSAHKNNAAGEKKTAGYVVIDAGVSSAAIVLNPAVIALHAGISNVLNKEFHNPLSTLRGDVTSEPGRNIYLSMSASI